jgi:hypothetical protein
MRKNTDLHLKTRTVTLKKRFRELPQVLCPVQKKMFCEDTGNDFVGEVFLGFPRGVIERGVHCRIVSFYEGFLTVFPIIINVFIFKVVIPIKVRLLIILSIPHILFLFPPFLLCCHLYKYKSPQQTLLVHATTISNVCANSNKNLILR